MLPRSTYLGILEWTYVQQSMLVREWLVTSQPCPTHTRLPQIITNVHRVWGAPRPLATMSWNLRVSDTAANFPLHSHFYWGKMAPLTGRARWWRRRLLVKLSSSPAPLFPKVFSDQNWWVLGRGNSGRASQQLILHPLYGPLTIYSIWAAGVVLKNQTLESKKVQKLFWL